MFNKLVLFLLFICIKRLAAELVNIQKLEDVYFVRGDDEIMRCPIDLAIQIKPRQDYSPNYYENARKYKKAIKNNFTTVQWLKNGQPVHRDNGDFFLPKNDTSIYEQVMHNVALSDEGIYSCKYTYNLTSPIIHKYLTFATEQQFRLRVDDRHLVDYPIISDAPYDQLVFKGSNVTFQCKHMDTKETQAFEWFAFKTINFTGPKVEKFLNLYNKTQQTRNVSFISEYIFDNKFDTLTISNVTDQNLGYYGCYAFASNRLEIRIATLKLVDNIVSLAATQEQQVTWLNIFIYSVIFVVVVCGLTLNYIRLGLSRKDKPKTGSLEQASKPSVPIYDYPPLQVEHFNCSNLKQSFICNPIYGILPSIFDTLDLSKFRRKSFDNYELIFLNKIGEGQFGEVHRCISKFKDGIEKQVAVKMLRSTLGVDTLSFLGPDRDRRDLIAEIEIMRLVSDHPYVVKMIDFFVKDNEPILLMMELVENGKLQTYLRDSRTHLKSTNDLDSYITSRDLIKFSYQVAKGMEYVASQGIIHRDIASRNVLISDERICKVADFGFARLINDECAYERTNSDKVPVRWMAPEALVENKFTFKSDVFSFGILIWEIVTLGSTPYENLTSQQVFQKVNMGERLERPNHCKIELFEVMSKCWSHNPKERPTFGELAVELEKLLLSENDYIELNQYPNHAYYNILTDKSDEKL